MAIKGLAVEEWEGKVLFERPALAPCWVVGLNAF